MIVALKPYDHDQFNSLQIKSYKLNLKGLSILAMAARKIPKVFVFDLDGCCWDPEMYELWGGGSPFSENKDGTLTDRSGTRVRLLGDVKNILYELKTDPQYKDSIVAVASTCDEPDWGRECIRKFPVGGGLKMFDVFQVCSPRC